MLRLKIYLFLILVGLSFQSWGQTKNQFPSQIWHKGTLYLTDGSSVNGMVKYDLETNLVQLQEETVITFTASNVTSFDIFDETYQGVRKFYSLPYALNGNYDTPVFFEVLTQGEHIALLCREYIATDTRGINNWAGMGMNPFWGHVKFLKLNTPASFVLEKLTKEESFAYTNETVAALSGLLAILSFKVP